MGKKKSRKARRTGTPVGEEVPSDCEVTEEAYEVECIVDHRNRRGGMEYKVRWRGWSPEYDEWLHYSKMDCPEAIHDYWVQHEARKGKKDTEGSSKKRDHPETHSAKSSRKSTASPVAKRLRVEDIEVGDNGDSGSVSPTISECLGRAPTPQQVDPKTDIPHDPLPTDQTKSSSVEPSEQQEPPKVNKSEPEPIPDEPFSFIDEQLQSSTVAASSSPCPPSEQPVRRSVPLPPAVPKRKRVQSLSSTETISPSKDVPNKDLEQKEKSVPILLEEDLRKSASPSVPLETKREVKQKSDPREIQATSTKKPEPPAKEPFVRPHGFDRGLTVERIHGFIRRADLLFAVVQFKNCDVVEILATQIVKHYEPMALIRGFEEHHIRSRRNAILSSPQQCTKQQVLG